MASEPVVDFVAKSLLQINPKVILINISPSNKKIIFEKPHTTTWNNHDLYVIGSFKFLKFDSYKKYPKHFFKKLQKQITKDDTLILYHSLLWTSEFIKLKKSVGCKLILQVEEMYTMCWDFKKYTNEIERKEIECVDQCIFVSQKLQKQFSNKFENAPILYGNYNLCESVKTKEKKEIIKLIYAGSLEDRKIKLLIETFCLLNSNYSLSIAGGGKEEFLQNEIHKLTNEQQNRINFLGKISNKDLNPLLQTFDIGLCPQDSTSNYNSYSFPSKILTYLRNGLNVVSTPIDALKDSQLSSIVNTSDEDTAQSFKKSIENCKFYTKDEISKVLNEEKNKFINELIKII